MELQSKEKERLPSGNQNFVGQNGAQQVQSFVQPLVQAPNSAGQQTPLSQTPPSAVVLKKAVSSTQPISDPEISEVDYFEQMNLKPVKIVSKRIAKVEKPSVASAVSSKLAVEAVNEVEAWGDLDIAIPQSQKKDSREKDKKEKKKITAVQDSSIDIDF